MPKKSIDRIPYKRYSSPREEWSVTVINKSYRVRIYPNSTQKTMFAKTFGCVRFVYNKMLEDKKMLKNTQAFCALQYKQHKK